MKPANAKAARSRKAAALAIALCIVGLALHSAAQQVQSAESAKGAPSAGGAERRVVVSLPDRKLALLKGGRIEKVYRVAVGKPSTPSPVGEFTIVNRVTNPTYYHKGQVIPAGKDNPLGTRWIGLSAKSYGIHGTNQPNSIGQAASTGCIRMRKRDLEELFALVAPGDTVEIRGERDERVAAIFGEAETVAQARVESGSADGQ